MGFYTTYSKMLVYCFYNAYPQLSTQLLAMVEMACSTSFMIVIYLCSQLLFENMVYKLLVY